MPRIMIAATLILSTAPVHADIFTYACKAKGKSSIVKIDTAKHTFKWGGKTYRIKDGNENDCPRLSWNVEGNEKSFNFCTATQGMADFRDGSTDVQCDQKR